MLGCVLLTFIAALLVFLALSPPSYDGKPIGQWLACFDSTSGLAQAQWEERLRKQAEATYALRQMGPDVFHHLRRMLQPHSRVRTFLHELKHEFMKREHVKVGSVAPRSPEEVQMLRAVEACAALGRDAAPMIPDLLLVLKINPHLSVRSRAAYALGEIRGAPEKVVPALLQSLSNRTDGNVLISLRKYGSDAERAVPTIVALVGGIERSVEEQKAVDRAVFYDLYEAIRALHQIAPREAEETLPLLRQVLEMERDPFWRSRLSELVNVISGASGSGSEQ